VCVLDVSHDVITVSAIPGHGPDEEQEISYKDIKVIGKGTFGVVYRAKLCETGQMVAIKKVFHNEKFKVSYIRNSHSQLDFIQILSYKFIFVNVLISTLSSLQFIVSSEGFKCTVLFAALLHEIIYDFKVQLEGTGSRSNL